jgi:hypothetical protein
MPESPSSSFIPKRGVGKKPTTVRKNNFVLLSIVSYALFVSAPLASAAVFIYERHTQNQFNKAVVNLDQAIEGFKEADLKRVTDFDDRLTLTKKLFDSHISMVSLLQTIEASTAQTVRFKSIDISRTDSSSVAVTGLLTTQKLDGTLFQRSSYSAAEIIKNPRFSEVTLLKEAPAGSGTETVGSGEPAVEFKVAFNFNAGDIKYTSSGGQPTTAPTETPVPGESAGLRPATDESISDNSETDI